MNWLPVILTLAALGFLFRLASNWCFDHDRWWISTFFARLEGTCYGIAIGFAVLWYPLHLAGLR